MASLSAADGMPNWIGFSVMDAPWCISADATGIFIGGARIPETHLEKRGLDGTPRWAQTFGLDLAPAAVTDIALEPGGVWVHSVGCHARNGHRGWNYDRRYAPDGFTYIPGGGVPRPRSRSVAAEPLDGG